MKKNTILILALFFSIFFASAQEKVKHKCSSDNIHLKLMKEDDSYKEKFERNNEDWIKYSNNKRAFNPVLNKNSQTTSYTQKNLTVVFHDMVTGLQPAFSNNIDDYNTNIVQHLNNYFNGSISGNDTSVQFCMARQNINMDCIISFVHQTNISNLNIDTTADISTIVSNAGSVSNFPQNKFINIYIVDSIVGDPVGFAHLPSSHGAPVDGIYVERNTLNSLQGLKTLVHEMGHYLGLFHTFGICDISILTNQTGPALFPECSCINNNCVFDGDMICDTPPMLLFDGIDCSSTFPIQSCSGVFLNQVDKQNYMDYLPDSCRILFTQGQIDRMQFMLEEDFGARSSLLSVGYCTVSCCEIDGCELVITPPAIIQNNQVLANDPLAFASSYNNCTSIPSPNMNYSWTLTLTEYNTQTVINTGSTANYNVTPSISGNYVLTLITSLASNADCSETVEYHFQVIPNAVFTGPSENICGIIPEMIISSVPSTPWFSWFRELPEPNTMQHPINSSVFNDVEVINTAIYSNDPNFGAISPPAGITDILRIGAIIDGAAPLPDGRSCYSSVSFNPTPENCKFRIHFIGMSGAPGFGNVSTNANFLNNSTNGDDATLGFVSLYNLESDVNNSNENITYGLNHLGNINNYNYCDNSMIYGKQPSSLFSTSYISSLTTNTIDNLNFLSMNNWEYVDLDYSEFANLNLEVTLTFFSKSENDINGIQRAYGYFAIECLGGGTPSSIEWNPDNIDLACSYPTDEGACTEIEIPLPKYVHSQYDSVGTDIFYLNNPNNLFASITVEQSTDNSSYILMPPTSFTITYLNLSPPNKNAIRVCNNNPANNQTIYYRITYRMLNQEIIRTIKVTNQYYHNNEPCSNPQGPNADIFGGTINNNQSQYIVCPDQNGPILTYTDPCFLGSPNYIFRWKAGGSILPQETGSSLNLTNTLLQYIFDGYNKCSNVITREVYYEDPYCSSPTWYASEAYVIFNIVGYGLSTEISITNDNGDPPCLNDTLNFLFNITLNSCVNVPSTLLDDYLLQNNITPPFNNSMIVNFKTENGIQFFTITQNFGNTIDFSLQDISFPMDNLNSLTNQYLLHPNDNDITIEVIYNFYGCSRTIEIPTTVFMGPGAEGGQIGLATNCDLNNIMNIDSGFSTNGYVWQYMDGNNWVPIPNAPNTSSLLNVGNYFSTFPIIIRRVSFGSIFCPETAFSNEIVFENPLSVIGFNLPTSYCSLDTLQTLPSISNNGISGTWIPSSSISGAGQYEFIPSDSTCGASYIYNVIIDPPTTPTFPNFPTEICYGQGIYIPSESYEQITGSWEPTINTSNSGTYTFNPDSGQCAVPIQHHINVNPSLTAIFSFPTTYCQGSGIITIPTLSDNGIPFSWFPDTINTNIVGTFNISGDATEPGNCGNTVDFTITILSANVSPVFNLPATLCEGSVAPILPTTSENGINGTWDIPITSNTTSGTYTFTPSSSPIQCAVPFVYNLTILTNCGIFLSWDGSVGCQQSEETFPNDIPTEDVNILDGDCIKVCENSTFTFNLTGSISLISSAEWIVTGGTILNPSNSSCVILWDSGASAYALQGTITLNDGSIIEINKCIEKVNSPVAQIGIMPDLELEYYTACIKSPIYFENLSSSNGGNENLYYLWDFGDGTYSTEFEPSHIYNVSNEYEVTLTVSNGCSCVSTHTVTVHISEESIDISCPSVACEGQVSEYNIDPSIIANGCNVQWSVIGGQILGQDSGISTIEVLWDAIDNDGFGYIFVQSDDCFQCISSVKIPVVQNTGTIVGNENTCPRSQYLYSLPQWPTTEYKWTLNNNGTGATLIVSNQRNEIFINTEDPGTIELSCQYYNTLLGCGGNATLTIDIESPIEIVGPETICVDVEGNFEVILESGNPPVNLNYIINGPNDYTYTGSAILFNLAFPEPGIYTFSVTADNYCNLSPYQIKVNPLPSPPVSIGGNTAICPGISSVFTCIAPTGSQTHWSVINGTILGSQIGNQVTVSFDPQATPPYSVSAWYENEDCASESVELLLSIPVLDTIINSYDTVVCGSTYGDYSVNEVNAENYIWSISPPEAGSIDTGQNTNSIHVLWNQESQTALVQLTMRKCGRNYVSSDLQVEIIDPPTVSIAPQNTTSCGGEVVIFDLTLTPSSAYTSSVWDFGDNTGLHTFSFGQQIAYTYQNPSTNSIYNVTASIFGASGCTVPSVANTQVTITPSPNVFVTPNINHSCGNSNNFSYTVNLESGSTVQWIFNNSNYSTSASISASMVGSYYAIVTNAEGCITTSNIYHTTNCNSQGNGNSGNGGGCISPAPMSFTVIQNTCQQISIGITDFGDASGFNWGTLIGANATITSSGSSYTASNIAPGSYQLPITPYFNSNPTGSTYCPTIVYKDFIVPYKAGVRYEIQCDNNTGMYDVTLIDFSAEYYQTPIETYQFTTDNGATWSPISSTSSYSIQLAPGTHQIGIRIDNAAYPSCDEIISIELPDLPDADFDVPDAVCLNTPMQFYAPPSSDPDLTYEWDFDGVINLQPNPIKTFENIGNPVVILTVTNKYGCVDFFITQVEVFGQVYTGSLNIDPINACDGDNLTITYLPGLFEPLPDTYTWYHNDSNTPIPVANNSLNQLVVNEPGQYFVHVADSNDCLTYTIEAVAANFIPIPTQPILSGTATICQGSSALLNVPVNPTVIYKWWLDGVAQPQWDNYTQINSLHNQIGTYTYEVVAQIESASGSFCSSDAAQFEVNVIAEPNLPSIVFNLYACSPYSIYVGISNPQAGITYSWSNGDTGNSTELNHDGPIRVTAKSASCEVSAQIDLPLDLYMHTWYYPQGCYSFCLEDKNEQNYIIGPLVEFEQWKWLKNNNTIQSGSGQVEPLGNLSTASYQLTLDTGYCHVVLSDIFIEEIACEECEFDFEPTAITPLLLNNECLYELEFFIGNPYSSTIAVNISSLGIEGYFVQNSFIVPVGGDYFTVLFYPINGFIGGLTTIVVNSNIDNKLCKKEVAIELPPLCEGAGKYISPNDTATTVQLILLAAPNPTEDTTTVYFNYGRTHKNYEIDIVDMYGRTLEVFLPKENNGSIGVDCSKYEAGQYFIVMKLNEQILKSTKLIIK
jgi:hypothetical protein